MGHLPHKYSGLHHMHTYLLVLLVMDWKRLKAVMRVESSGWLTNLAVMKVGLMVEH